MKYSAFGHSARALVLTALLTAFFGITPAGAQSLSSLMFFNGSQAAGGVTLGTDGALYGIALESGVSGGATSGLIYRVTTDASQVGTLYQYGRLGVFTGSHPRGTLVRDASGNLYGVTLYNDLSSPTAVGTGTIFKITQTGIYTRLYAFSNFTTTTAPLLNADGGTPTGSLMVANDGFLYGTTTAGGTYGSGTIFKIRVDGTGFASIYSFGALTGENADSTALDLRPINADGAFPQVRLLQASDGDLYGTTFTGGVNGTGVIFSLKRDGSGFRVLKSFDSTPPTITDTADPNYGLIKLSPSGGYPRAGLVQAANGFLYGTATGLGPVGYGTLYRIAPSGAGFVVLKAFDGTTGATPNGELIIALDGTIVGTTQEGAVQANGLAAAGAIYSMSLDGATFTNLYVFGADGAIPANGVIQTSDGSFYGTTSQGSPYNAGTVFKFGVATNKEALGTPVPFDDGGPIAPWLIAALALLAASRRFAASK